MAERYRLFGVEMSPYSVKVRAWFRYRGIPFDWVIRNTENMAEFTQLAKLPLLPMVVTPAGKVLQDSTPIIEELEALHFGSMDDENSIYPSDPELKFVDQLLEEFADEWGNKWMFHYRWKSDVDQQGSAARLATLMLPKDAKEDQSKQMSAMIRERMVGRVWFVGSNENNAPIIERSLIQFLDDLELHLQQHSYMLGERPAFCDFALWAQLYCLRTDPTGAAIVEGRAPAVLDWIQRMHFPRATGAYADWSQLAETLTPIISNQIEKLFLPWSTANAQALAESAEEFEVELDGVMWRQKPQKYHARSLKALQGKFSHLDQHGPAVALMESLGCAQHLCSSKL